MPVELVIFDCDGVLIDSELLSVQADVECLAEHGIAITADEMIERYTGLSSAAMLRDIEAQLGRAVPPIGDNHPILRALFEAQLRPIAGVAEMLDALSGYSRCVASSGTPERLFHSLSLVGLYERFHPHIFSAVEVVRGKPAPDLFLHAAHRMAAAPEHCAVVEDSLAGVAAAVAAGMPAIGFTGGSHCRPGHAVRLRDAGAADTINDMTQLPAALARLRT